MKKTYASDGTVKFTCGQNDDLIKKTQLKPTPSDPNTPCPYCSPYCGGAAGDNKTVCEVIKTVSTTAIQPVSRYPPRRIIIIIIIIKDTNDIYIIIGVIP